jgi:hypothetical protein
MTSSNYFFLLFLCCSFLNRTLHRSTPRPRSRVTWLGRCRTTTTRTRARGATRRRRRLSTRSRRRRRRWCCTRRRSAACAARSRTAARCAPRRGDSASPWTSATSPWTPRSAARSRRSSPRGAAASPSRSSSSAAGSWGEPTRCGGCTRPASSAASPRAPRGRTRPSSAAGSASCLATAATDPAGCSWRRRGTPAAAWIATRTDWCAAPVVVLDHSVHKPFSLPVVQRLLERQEKDELWTQHSSTVGSLLSVLGAEQLDS